MSYLIAIDVGIKNLSFCVYDFTNSQCICWENVCLVPNGRYIPQHNVAYVRAFVEKYQHYFSNAFAVIIERQMRCNIIILDVIPPLCIVYYLYPLPLYHGFEFGLAV